MRKISRTVWFLAAALMSFSVPFSASADTCPAPNLNGSGTWNNSGSWNLSASCKNGKIAGKIAVGGSNSCSNFGVVGEMKGANVSLAQNGYACGTWSMEIPYTTRTLDFTANSGDYGGLSISGWKWEGN